MIIKVFLLLSIMLWLLNDNALQYPSKYCIYQILFFPPIFVMDSQCYWGWQARAICWHLWEQGTPGIREQVGASLKSCLLCWGRLDKPKTSNKLFVPWCHFPFPLAIQTINLKSSYLSYLCWQYHHERLRGASRFCQSKERRLGSVCFMDLTHWHESRQTTF